MPAFAGRLMRAAIDALFNLFTGGGRGGGGGAGGTSAGGLQVGGLVVASGERPGDSNRRR